VKSAVVGCFMISTDQVRIIV